MCRWTNVEGRPALQIKGRLAAFFHAGIEIQ
jgi:hypothetical protein